MKSPEARSRETKRMRMPPPPSSGSELPEMCREGPQRLRVAFLHSGMAALRGKERLHGQEVSGRQDAPVTCNDELKDQGEVLAAAHGRTCVCLMVRSKGLLTKGSQPWMIMEDAVFYLRVPSVA